MSLSLLWNHFTLVTSGIAKCKYCPVEYNIKKTTASLRYHLKYKHNEKVQSLHEDTESESLLDEESNSDKSTTQKKRRLTKEDYSRRLVIFNDFESSTGDMVIFEIFNADENQVVKLNSLPKGFENPINADEKYRLVGVVDLTQRATRRRSHENVNSEVGTMGHFTAICLRETEWWEYDDTQDQPRMKRGSAYLNAQILVYVRE
ncbi:hypothetical protein KQX54_003542 [Cotesia glomerata]|uniref:BED-type domain-containing protein n=1 Tax=Cotesia glomerata TaxID=32391 RepID=A0AAV7IZ84_COTGL|nr:hypothetical protein KQX54_003542 [Cotesia glomerata]